MELDSILERVTRSEDRIATAFENAERNHQYITTRLDAVEQSIKDIELSLSKYRGFWGAITMIASAVMTCLVMFWDFIKQRIVGN